MPYHMGGVSLDELDTDELAALAGMLHDGWSTAMRVYDYGPYGSYVPDGLDAPPVVEVERDGPRQGLHPMAVEAEYTYMPVANEYTARQLGCRRQACTVCEHQSCGYCPTCNPHGIAPNGEAYDDLAAV